MRPDRREAAVALGLLGLGAVIVLFTSTRQWFEVTDTTLSISPADLELMTGGKVAPAAFALGLVGLAGIVAVLATRGLGRRLVGAVLGLTGIGVVLTSLAPSRPTDFAFTTYGDPGDVVLVGTTWPTVSLVGGVLLAAGGLLIAVRAARWPAMGSRYDSPSARAAPVADDPWSALDRGDDPTLPREHPDPRTE